MEITQLRYFVLVAENGSTAKAAAEARVSQSTISKSLLRLEQELGLPLFDRQGTHLVLNTAGQELLQRAKPILSAFRRLPADITDHYHPHRHYRINVSDAACPITGFIHSFLQSEPDTEIILTESSWIDDCDISIAASPSGRDEDNVPLFTEEFAFAVPASLAGNLPENPSLLQLSQIPLVMPPDGGNLRLLIDRTLSGLPASFLPRLTAASEEMLRELVTLGDGGTFWPEKSWPLPDSGSIRLYHPAGLELRRTIFAQLAPDKNRSSVEPLLDAMRAYFQE